MIHEKIYWFSSLKCTMYMYFRVKLAKKNCIKWLYEKIKMEYTCCFPIFVGITYRSPPSEQSSRAPNTLHKEKPPFFQQTATAVPSGVHFMHLTGPAF